ncbi:serine/threonine-protein kinase [Dactylosporangium sp. CA-092794]|uniref:serine/threonine-protein kinase n=1 Tax=Dactylosporangium sp. CA-092794 TaxID=3239929 RepID=UPI003D92F022
MLADARLKQRYVVARHPLAHNGMSEVWPARDTALDRDVIVKAINVAGLDVDAVRRFRREALLTARLSHPGVPAVFDLGEHEGRPYLVLEKIDGVDLTDLTAERHPLPIPWVCAIGAQISSVLIAAERLRLVHRDLKPSNVMLEPSGAVKVLDFGLAVIPGDERYSRITGTGQSLGTVGYMAPEQVRGEPTDHRTDLYGLGGVLFHLLTAEPPFDRDTTVSTLYHQLSTPPPHPVALRAETPDVLDDLVHALLSARPEDRPGDAAEVYAALAPLAAPLPPLPGLVTDGIDPVRAYAAVVGRQPGWSTGPRAAPDQPVVPDADEAERLAGAGQFRAAARLWRQLADRQEREHGPADPLAFEYRVRVALAHASLHEHERALRLLNGMVEQWTRLGDAGQAQVRRLRAEIERLQGGADPAD